MNRRIFVKRSLIVSSGILLSHAFISCTSEKIQLQNLLGKSEDLLKKQVKNGDQHFGYYPNYQRKVALKQKGIKMILEMVFFG